MSKAESARNDSRNEMISQSNTVNSWLADDGIAAASFPSEDDAALS